MVRGDLGRILDKALAKEPGQRYPSVAMLADDLQHWLAGAPVQATGNHLRYRASKFIRRNLAAVTTVAVLTLALIATSIIAVTTALSERAQRQIAQTELGRSNAVRDYVMLMLRDAGDDAEGATVTGRQALQRGAETVQARFADDPESGATTLLMLADLFNQIGDAEGAVPLLEQIVNWPGAQAQPATLAQARYQLAQLENTRGNPAYARELYDQATAFWRTDPVASATILNESRIIEARLLRAEGKPAAAVATLEAAIAERRDRLGLIDRELASQLSSLSTALIESGQLQPAYEASDQALSLLQSLDMTHSTVGLGALNNRAVAATYLRRMDEATADFRKVVAIHRDLFGRNSHLASAELNLSRMLMSVDNHAEAVPLAEEALAIATSERGETSSLAVHARIMLAEALTGAGRTDEALQQAELGLSLASDHYRQSSDLLYVTALRVRSVVRINAGDVTGGRADMDAAQAELETLGPAGIPHLEVLRQVRQRLLGENG